jgi:hypothetical protein
MYADMGEAGEGAGYPTNRMDEDEGTVAPGREAPLTQHMAHSLDGFTEGGLRRTNSFNATMPHGGVVDRTYMCVAAGGEGEMGMGEAMTKEEEEEYAFWMAQQRRMREQRAIQEGQQVSSTYAHAILHH